MDNLNQTLTSELPCVNCPRYDPKLSLMMKPENLERRMSDDQIETFIMMNEISNYDRCFFQYLSTNWKFTVKTDFKNEVY